MVPLTRLNGKEFYANPHQIEFMEKTPDTVLTMLSGKKLVVRETPDEVIEGIVKYRQRLMPMVLNRDKDNNVVIPIGNEL